MIETFFLSLRNEIRRLHEALGDLRVTVAEDRPLEGESMFVEALGDLAEELASEAGEALAVAEEGLKAAAPPFDAEHARVALSSCQERVDPIRERFAAELIHYERIAELERLARRRSEEWKGWAESVRRGAEACRTPLDGVHRALVACWRQLAERAGASVSVRAVNVGPRLTLVGPESRATTFTQRAEQGDEPCHRTRSEQNRSTIF